MQDNLISMSKKPDEVSASSVEKTNETIQTLNQMIAEAETGAGNLCFVFDDNNDNTRQILTYVSVNKKGRLLEQPPWVIS